MIRGALSGQLVGTMRRRGASFGPGSGVGGGLSAALDLNFTSGTLDSRVTYTGASLATLTDATGAIAYKPHNLALHSNTFSDAVYDAWNMSVTSAATNAPDGTLTAWKLIEGNGIQLYGQVVTIVAGNTYTQGIRAKAAERRYLVGRHQDSSRKIVIDLQTATVFDAGTGFSPIITSSGGWVTVALTFTASSTGASYEFQWGLSDDGSLSAGSYDNYAGTAGWGIYICWAQFCQGSALQPYYPTTSAAYYGPRFTYDPVTHAALGLLIEEQRTNLFQWSRDFSNAAWTKQASASTAVRNAVGVDGIASSASTITESTGYFARSVYQSVTGSSGAYSTSVSFQQAAGPTRYLRITIVSGPSDFGYVTVNLKTGAIAQAAAAIGTASAASATVTYQPSTGMWRVSLSCTLAAPPTFVFFVPIDATPVVVAGDYGRNLYTGDGSTSWVLDAAQFEPGAFATTPIHTTSASVTRAADSATMTGSNFSSWFNATQGTFVAETRRVSATVYSGVMATDNGAGFGAGYGMLVRFNNSGSVEVGGNSSAVSRTGLNAVGSLDKVAYNYSVGGSNPMNISANGGAVGNLATTDYTGTGVARLIIGGGPNGTLNAPIARLRYYNTALTNAQLQALTT